MLGMAHLWGGAELAALTSCAPRAQAWAVAGWWRPEGERRPENSTAPPRSPSSAGCSRLCRV